MGRQKTREEFIIQAIKTHDNKYDYSKTIYINTATKIIIICPIHGEFFQRPNDHISGGYGCPLCAIDLISKTNNKTAKEKYFNSVAKVHNNKYDYSKAVYTKAREKIIIICPEHGEFSQLASIHLLGRGCSKCKESKGERSIREWLIANNINFNQEHRFDDCKNESYLPFDFYLPEHNCCIEFDGIQHFKPHSFNHSDQTIETKRANLTFTRLKDAIKNEYCKEKGIRLIRIPYTQLKNVPKILDLKGFL
jgi:very-short-patch-repair endonuclease